MQMTISEQQDAVVISIRGDLNSKTAPQLGKTLEKQLRPGLGRLIINFTEINYIDSAGVGMLVSCYKQATQNKTSFALASVAGRVCSILKLTRLDKFFTIYGSLEDALAWKEIG